MASKPAELRAPDETDSLSRLLGAGIARNHFGEHLAIRNWFSTPEFTEPSPAALELLTKQPSSVRVRNKKQIQDSQAALENPEKWLFLDTETTGLAGGTGTYAFLVGLAWWDAGGLQVEQYPNRRPGPRARYADPATTPAKSQSRTGGRIGTWHCDGVHFRRN